MKHGQSALFACKRSIFRHLGKGVEPLFASPKLLGNLKKGGDDKAKPPNRAIGNKLLLYADKLICRRVHYHVKVGLIDALPKNHMPYQHGSSSLPSESVIDWNVLVLF